MAASLDNAERFGLEGRWPRAAVVQDIFWRGRWGEAERQADEWLEDDSPNINEPSVSTVRARIRLARDDVVGAAADCRRALDALGDEWYVIEDDHAAAVCACAEVALADDRRDDAVALVEKLIAQGGVDQQSPATAPVELALLLEKLGRSGTAIVEAHDDRPQIPWLQAGAAVVQEEYADAAELLAELRTPPLEAAVRLRAAELLVTGGRRAEADVQLQKALAFYRSVGATRYIREGEALLAASA
jgi:tetratricopeptide (TPR) repeat protein